MLWKKLIERKVNTDTLWRGLADRRQWVQYLYKPKPGESHPQHSFYRRLYPSIIKDIEVRSFFNIINHLHLYFLYRRLKTTGGVENTICRESTVGVKIARGFIVCR